MQRDTLVRNDTLNRLLFNESKKKECINNFSRSSHTMAIPFDNSFKKANSALKYINEFEPNSGLLKFESEIICNSPSSTILKAVVENRNWKEDGFHIEKDNEEYKNRRKNEEDSFCPENDDDEQITEEMNDELIESKSYQAECEDAGYDLALLKNNNEVLDIRKTPRKVKKSHKVTQKYWERRTFWKKSEDLKILELIEVYGENWNLIAEKIKTRTAEAIEFRYNKRLNPNLNFTIFTPEEDRLLIKLYLEKGSVWREIKKHFPGRSIDLIKNRFHRHLKSFVPEVKKPKKLRRWKNKNGEWRTQSLTPKIRAPIQSSLIETRRQKSTTKNAEKVQNFDILQKNYKELESNFAKICTITNEQLNKSENQVILSVAKNKERILNNEIVKIYLIKKLTLLNAFQEADIGKVKIILNEKIQILISLIHIEKEKLKSLNESTS
jgi:hypothetical protein